MAQYLHSIDKFYFPRSTRFPEQFMDDVRALVRMATSEIIEQFSQVYLHLLLYVTLVVHAHTAALCLLF